MNALAGEIVMLVVIGAAVAVVFARLRHRMPSAATAPGNELGRFDGLSEAERCDLVFAYAALDDPRADRWLERALDDPSETVALAAARAMSNGSGAAALARFLAARPSARSTRIAQTLELLS